MDAQVPAPEDLPPPPHDPAGPSPLRRPGSVRRTSTIDMTWPGGRWTPVHMDCRARDIFTPLAGGAPVVMAEDQATVRFSTDRVVEAIETRPPRPGVERLVGARGGGYLRQVLQQALPEARAKAEPIYLLLDDLAGASLICGWAWSRWTDDWRRRPGQTLAPQRPMEGVCTGFRPGSRAIWRQGEPSPVQNTTLVPPLPHPDDPQGWHDIATLFGVSMRRARRIDVWVDDVIRIDSTFQDSASTPEGGERAAVHEYLLEATADPATGTLLSVRADPRTLPYPECPAAVANIGRLVGTPLAELRERVLVALAKTAGCTHLNDALRALAEVPALVAQRAERLKG